MEPRTIMYSCFCFTEWNGRDDLVQHVEMDLNFTAENLGLGEKEYYEKQLATFSVREAVLAYNQVKIVPKD
nr:hypothetical protein Iba_chr08bCG9660 [Ipomoea batatas]